MTESPQSPLTTLAAILRGEPVVPVADNLHGTVLLDAAAAHGVTGLIAERLTTAALAQWPSVVQSALRRERVLGAALEALQQGELVAVLDALAARNVHGLLLKGSVLAHTIYQRPALRPRFDVDLLVRRQHIDIVAEVMTARGYARPNQVTGELVMHQFDFARKDAQGVWHVFDFHWKLANRQVVADLLSYDELDHDATPIATLGCHARGLDAVHALILACVHRLAHHPGDERLIWLYDIHLLAESLDHAQAERFARLASDRAVAAVCLDGLEAAKRWFHTSVPNLIHQQLTEAAANSEASATCIGASGNRIDELFADLKALPRWSHRARLVYEHAFPPARFIQGSYMVSNRAWLPALYTHRLVRAAWRWLRRDAGVGHASTSSLLQIAGSNSQIPTPKSQDEQNG